MKYSLVTEEPPWRRLLCRPPRPEPPMDTGPGVGPWLIHSGLTFSYGTRIVKDAKFMAGFLRMVAPEWPFTISPISMYPGGYWGVWCERKILPCYVNINYQRRIINPLFLQELEKFRREGIHDK